MVKIEFLDTLYRWKVEAEQKLEELEERSNDPLPNDEAYWRILRNIEIENAKRLVNRYKTVIQSYMLYHNL